jgi:hypothetical protein
MIGEGERKIVIIWISYSGFGGPYIITARKIKQNQKKERIKMPKYPNKQT